MDAQEIAQYYPLPDAEYLRGELETLQNDFHAFEESIAGGPDCICIDRPDPSSKKPVDTGCYCNPCTCPTDKHPCYKDSEFNNGDASAKGLRAALDRLTRQANAMKTAQDEGAGCVCKGAAEAGTKTVTETTTGTRPGTQTEVVETEEGGPKTPREGFGGGPGVLESPFVELGPYDHFTFASLNLVTGTQTGTQTKAVKTEEGGPKTPRESLGGGPGVIESPFLEPGPYDRLTFASLNLVTGTQTGTPTKAIKTEEGAPKTPRESSGGGPEVFQSPFLEQGPYDRLTFAGLGLL